jgi:hypothetical protein
MAGTTPAAASSEIFLNLDRARCALSAEIAGIPSLTLEVGAIDRARE